MNNNTTRNALAKSLSTSLNELSAHSEQVVNHDKNENCLESKLLKLVSIINLRNYNIMKGRVNVKAN